MTNIIFTRKSSNAKTGPIPVTTTDRESCPDTCPLKRNGCYADNSHMGVMWTKLTETIPGESFKHGRASITPIDWDTLCDNVESLPEDQLWRHNQAGDLPHKHGKIDRAKVNRLVKSNTGKKGFTYSHHVPSPHNLAIIESANTKGFTINLSANGPRHVDQLIKLTDAPIVTILPESDHGKKQVQSPGGKTITVCPATYRDNITCKSCGLCAVRDRKTVIGFPLHGATKNKAKESVN